MATCLVATILDVFKCPLNPLSVEILESLDVEILKSLEQEISYSFLESFILGISDTHG